ncbi:MAG: hypothetical protein ACSLFP_18465 [Acidimicrobiales bacterium]
MLWHAVELDLDAAAPEVDVALRGLRQGAMHPMAPRTSVSLRVVSAGGVHHVEDNGDLLATVATARAVLDTAFTRTYRRALELAALGGWVRVHGTILQVAGQRWAVVGPAGAGKTTLAIAALAAGEQAEVDESFLVRDGEVLGVARRFHVKPGSEAIVPAAAPWLDAAPVLEGTPPLRLLDPTEAGRPWHLTCGPVDHVALVERGAATDLRLVGATEAAPSVMGQAFPTVEARSTVVREVSSLLRGASVHRLAVGPDGRALEALRVVAAPGGAR